MKVIHNPELLKETFKNAVLRNGNIQIAVFQFYPQILSDICGMGKDEFLDMLEGKLTCMYARDWYIYTDETLEEAKERVKNFPLHFIETSSRIFHPKVYFFTNSERNEWEAIVSSANMTYGLEHNMQSSVHITHEDDTEGEPLRRKLEEYFDYLQTIKLSRKQINMIREEEEKTLEETQEGFKIAINVFLEAIEPSVGKHITSHKRWDIMKRALLGESYGSIGKDWNLSGEQARNLTRQGINILIRRYGAIQEAYQTLISNPAYMAASDKAYANSRFFKKSLDLLNRIHRTKR